MDTLIRRSHLNLGRVTFIVLILHVKGQDLCHCQDSTQCATYKERGCFPCQFSWFGSKCQTQNAAYGKSTTQSTTYIQCDGTCDVRESRYAVDGIQSTDDVTKCAQTVNSTSGHWWSLTLPRANLISSVRVFFPDVGTSVEGLQVLVNGKTCYTATTATIPRDLYCNELLEGYNITLYLPPRGARALALCEVEVFLCGDGWYGVQCDQKCTCMNTMEICNKLSGNCSSGCPDGYTGTDCKVCADGRYGLNCSEVCGNCLNEDICDKTTGACPAGCESGWFDPYCKSPCVDGRYGLQCSSLCGSCLSGVACNKSTGRCPSTCAPGYTGQLCTQGCESGRHGIDCVSTCGRCRDGQACDAVTGTCFQGCEAGWKGNNCDSECESGTYGMDCVQQCGHCKEFVPCNTTTGHCPDGCRQGWRGDDCKTECPPYLYGANCQKICGTCSNNDVCDRVTGWCSSGCKPGLKPPLCSEDCDNGKYGLNCQSQCGHCKDGEPCNKISGKCQNGCQPGKTGENCLSDCPDGEYGDACSLTCGQCRDGDLCDKVTGDCPFGCQIGYNGSQCQSACQPGTYGFQCLKKCGQCRDLTQCDFATGLCPSGCQPGWTSDNCNQVCTNKTYGDNCGETCGNCKNDDYCDRVTGVCPDGCSSGYKWELCTQQCEAGRYGEDCTMTCGHCKDSVPCDHVTGQCPGLCEPGWKGQDCQTECRDGAYGENCARNCGNCITNSVCGKVTGECPEGCEPGWVGYNCSTECSPGTYGPGCTYECGACHGGVACHTLTGFCTGGCQPGWTGDRCKTECPEGSHGDGCGGRCGRCVEGTQCNTSTGACPAGCEPGYTGSACVEECSARYYGARCSLICGQCQEAGCHHVTGMCESCKPGYKGQRCTQECGVGEYGPDCSLECGACREGTTCSKINGTCPDGCRPGSSGDRCTVACPNGKYGGGCVNDCGHCLDGVVCDTNTGQCPGQCEISWDGDRCDRRCDDGNYGRGCELTCGKCSGDESCNKVTGVCPLSCDQGFTGDLCQEELPPEEEDMTGAIAGGILGLIAIAIIVIMFVFCFIRRKKSKSPYKPADDVVLDPLETGDTYSRVGYESISRASNASSRLQSEISLPYVPPVDLESTLGLSIPIYNSSNISASELSGQTVEDEDKMDIVSVRSEYPWPTDEESSTAFSVYEIGEHIEMKMAAGGFENEFSMLPKGMRFPHINGSLLENAEKNRHPRAIPYDSSRVLLSKTNTGESEYINASHIDGFRIMEEYIATQGPMPKTVNDFWRMVWEKRVCKIIMLCKTKENGRIKCYKYWPDAKDGHTYGNLSVSCDKVINRSNYTIREFYVYDHQVGEKRLVTQFQITCWPESGFPSPPVLVHFMKCANKIDTTQRPTVVHCSTGMGRTGCYIAVNSVAEQARLEPELDVFKFVCRMRQQRPEMVRTRVQYAGVHHALHDMLASRDTLLTTDLLLDKYRRTHFRTLSSNSPLGAEFEALDEMRPSLSTEETVLARRGDNIMKNRRHDILPGSPHRVILKGTSLKPGAYINAVYLPSVLHRRGFIVTQHPLKHTVEQFWTLVQEQESVTIVNLTPAVLSPHDRLDYGEYMPRSPGQALSVGKYEILLKSTEDGREDIPEKTLILRTRGAGDFIPSRHIKVFSVADWTGDEDIPSSKYVFLILMDALVRRQKDAGQHPIIVHCLDGASRSGLLCTVSNIISRLKLDKEVDVFLSVRELQFIRPAIVTSFSQYSFCYEMARNFLKTLEHS